MKKNVGAHVAPYGAVELKRVRWKYQLIGLAVSIVAHLSVIVAYHIIGSFDDDEPPTVTVRVVKYSDLGPPPSITSASLPPPIAVTPAMVKPSIGVPVPVPDASVSPEQTIASQVELSQAPSPVVEGETGETGIRIEQDIRIEDDNAPPPDFVPVEKEPAVVRKVEPKYPELALRAGLEGTVWVKIWVDREGKPRKAVIVKSSSEIFEKPAVDAAMQFVFTPAYMNQGPVAVWVAIPFRFTIKK